MTSYSNRDQKTPKQKLAESEKDLQAFVDSFSDLAIIVDEEGRYEEILTPGHDLLYAPEEEVLGKKVDEVLPSEVAGLFLEQIEEAVEADQPHRVEYPLEIDGVTRWFRAWLNPYKRKEEDRTLVATAIRDITKEKEKIKKLRRMRYTVRSATEGIARADMEETIKYVNPAFLDLLGYESQKEVIGHRITELTVNEEKEKKIIDLLRKNGSWSGEIELGRKDGTTFFAHASASIMRNEAGEPLEILSYFVDISGRKLKEKTIEEERNRLRKLHDAVDLLQKSDSEEEVLQTAVNVAEEMLGFEICAIGIQEGDYLVVKTLSSGLSSEETVKFQLGEGIAGKTVEKGETFWGEDMRKDPDAKPVKSNFRAFISVPIGKLGNFQVISEEVGKFDSRDVELAEILANHLNEELKRIRLEEELRHQANRDPLTGLYNRRYFNETLQKEVERCQRYERSLAFLISDIDRFKKVNDRYSHQVGDQVLQEVANLLEENFRSADTVVRYGGDEFLVMMPETSGESKNTVKRLQDKLSQWNEQSDLLDFSLTLAMGVSHWSPDQDRDVEEALKEADRKMYEDKGR